jgi:orotidine-5'-phosphate decarboxylase
LNPFIQRLRDASNANGSLISIGLDPDPERMPVDLLDFNRDIIDATKDLVCTYKPNLAFYEALGMPGLETLRKTIEHIRDVAPKVIILGDAKRGDIASTNAAYAKALFEVWGFDAITVNAFAGGESLKPFFDYEDRGVFVWCRSSNPGSQEFQDLKVSVDGQGPYFYEWIAQRSRDWNNHGNVCLVVGATYPEQLSVVRSRCPGMPVLIPAIGAQGGDLENSVKFGIDADYPNIIINSSRSVLYASANKNDFAMAARAVAEKLRDDVNRILKQEGMEWP